MICVPQVDNLTFLVRKCMGIAFSIIWCSHLLLKHSWHRPLLPPHGILSYEGRMLRKILPSMLTEQAWGASPVYWLNICKWYVNKANLAKCSSFFQPVTLLHTPSLSSSLPKKVEQWFHRVLGSETTCNSNLLVGAQFIILEVEFLTK